MVLEAWDACKPVVATKVVSIVNDLKDGLVARVKPDSIAGCIKQSSGRSQGDGQARQGQDAAGSRTNLAGIT